MIIDVLNLICDDIKKQYPEDSNDIDEYMNHLEQIFSTDNKISIKENSNDKRRL